MTSMRMFAEHSDLKISGEREFVLSNEIKLNRVLADYFVNSLH